MKPTYSIRILVVDDHAMVRKGLVTFLGSKLDMKVVGEASNGQEALKQCEFLQPDVILMDLVMPEMDGVDAIRAIRQRWSQVQVLALTNFQEKNLVQEALRAGAVGYLLKNITGDNLAEAIRSAYQGRSTLAPEVKDDLTRDSHPPSCQPGKSSLNRSRRC